MNVVVYRQGSLVVARERGGWRVHDEADSALIDDDGMIAMIHTQAIHAGVVDVVAAALSARVRGDSFHVHAGAVAYGAGLVLVVGDGGAGKTTTCLALASGGHLMGDDVSFLCVVDGVVVARPWRRPLHVGEVTRSMFPSLELLEAAPPTRAGKRQARLPTSSMAGDDALELAPPTAVWALVVPSIDHRPGSRTVAAALSPTQALEHLITASAMVLWPGVPHAQRHLELLGQTAARPAYSVTIGQDARDDAAVIERALVRAGLHLGDPR